MFRDYLAQFKDEIRVISKPVNPDHELAAFLLKDRTTPFLFEDVRGRRVLGNIWADRRRIASAMETTVEQLPKLLLRAMRHPAGFDEVANPYARSDDQDWERMPVPWYFPGDAGRYITPCIFVSEYGGMRNVSFHRIQVMGPRRGAIRIVPRHLDALRRQAEKDGKDLPVNIVMTFSPDVLLAGAMVLGLGDDELAIASALRHAWSGKPLQVARMPNGVLAPADAEVVFSGRVTHEMVDEGPFLDILGTYDPKRKQPVVLIDEIWAKRDPLVYALLSGGIEHFYLMGMPREPAIYDAVGRAVAKVRAVRLTEGGCCWLHGVVSIEKRHQGDAKNAAMAALGAHTSMKQVIVVDHDIDIFDDRQVEWALATRFQADRGLTVIHGARGSSLDLSAGETTAKLAIDATAPVGRLEEFRRHL